jgi:hypothetical protein
MLENVKERLLQYLDLIKISGLIDACESIHLCFIGNDEIPLKYEEIIEYNTDQKITIMKVSNRLDDFELPTLQYLYNFCINSTRTAEYDILYLHTKGVGKDRNECIEDQVKYMTHFNIEKWKDCENLLQRFATCGVDLRTQPTLHYSGNFWWAKASHVSKLPSPYDFNNLTKYPNPLNSIRHNQEFWLCHQKNADQHGSLWDCGINCYERHLHRYPPEKYT